VRDLYKYFICPGILAGLLVWPHLGWSWGWKSAVGVWLALTIFNGIKGNWKKGN